MPKEMVRELWDSIDEEDLEGSVENVWRWSGREGYFADIGESIRTKDAPMVVAFFERCWPRLRECIRAELAIETKSEADKALRLLTAAPQEQG